MFRSIDTITIIGVGNRKLFMLCMMSCVTIFCIASYSFHHSSYAKTLICKAYLHPNQIYTFAPDAHTYKSTISIKVPINIKLYA